MEVGQPRIYRRNIHPDGQERQRGGGAGEAAGMGGPTLTCSR